MNGHNELIAAAIGIGVLGLLVLAKIFAGSHRRAFREGHSAALAVVREQQATQALELRRARRQGHPVRNTAVAAGVLAGIWFAFLHHAGSVAATGAAAKAATKTAAKTAAKARTIIKTVNIPAPKVPPAVAHSSFPLSGTEIVIIAIVLILGAVAYGINRVRAREL
jgi:hypothetical protein